MKENKKSGIRCAQTVYETEDLEKEENDLLCELASAPGAFDKRKLEAEAVVEDEELILRLVESRGTVRLRRLELHLQVTTVYNFCN